MIKPAIVLTTIAVFLFLLNPFAYSQVELELLNTNIYWGESYDIAVYGDRVFVANGEGGLKILDVSDEQNPVELEPLYVDDGEIMAVEVVDTVLYVTGFADEGFISIFDISDSGELSEISQLNIGFYGLDLKINHNLAIIGNCLIVSLADISNPYIICELEGDGNLRNQDMDIIDSNTVMLTETSSGNGYIKFYNISNGENPELISSYYSADFIPVEIFLDDQYAFIGNHGYLTAFDISNINDISMLGSIDCDYEGSIYNYVRFKKIVVSDTNTLLVVVYNEESHHSKLAMLDISDIQNISEISVTNVEDTTIDMVNNGNELFLITCHMGMNVYEIQNQESVNRLYGFGNHIKLVEIIPVDDGFVGYYTPFYRAKGILYAFNLNDPLHPELKGSFEVDTRLAGGSAYSDGYLYICNAEEGVSVIDISDMSNPVQHSTILTSEYISDVLIIDEYIIYRIDGSIRLAELSSPETEIYTFGVYETISFNSEYLILAGGTEISIFDISDIENPQELGSIDLYCDRISEISVTENMIYTKLFSIDDEFGGDYYKLFYVDISEPDSPRVCYESGWELLNIASFIYGIEKYLVSMTEYYEDSSLSIYDYSNPESPADIGYYNYGLIGDCFHPWDVIWMDGYLYGYGGNTLQVFNFPFEMDVTEDIEKGLPTEYSILNAYPNPFNPTLNVGVSLPQPGDLQVKVYNINGQLVEVLANGRFSTGNHNLMFNGTNLSSGVYFINAVVPGQMNQTKRVTLVK